MSESIVKPPMQVVQPVHPREQIEPREPAAYPKYPKRPAGARRPVYLATDEDTEG